MTAFLLLGSNIEDRSKNIENALFFIDKIASIIKTSRIYETEPWGYKNQPFFLNRAIKIETDLSPQNLLLKLKEIEKTIGRKRAKKYGPRIIDIDILLYGDLVLNEKHLVIPHKKLANRKFALVCLQEIAEDFIHPIHKKTISELLLELDKK
ncbi:MAG: 2-amino-4-hydroxy-6-hydroxymethyldihydropteridine diphosphokinase [bacterium]